MQKIHLDECKLIIIKTINQAIHDYLTLSYSIKPIEQLCYKAATQFLFNNKYKIQYGHSEKSLNDLLEIISLDINWVRKKVIYLKNKRIDYYRKQKANHYVI
jgi:hypothetical protein